MSLSTGLIRNIAVPRKEVFVNHLCDIFNTMSVFNKRYFADVTTELFTNGERRQAIPCHVPPPSIESLCRLKTCISFHGSLAYQANVFGTH